MQHTTVYAKKKMDYLIKPP